MTARLEVWAPAGLPEIAPGDDLVALLADAAAATTRRSTATSSCSRRRSSPRPRAAWSSADDREQAITDETVRVVATREHSTGVTRIVENRLGLVMAAAGVDALEHARGHRAAAAGRPGRVARVACGPGCRDVFGARIGVVVTDTAGRPWRQGVTDIAIGAAGLVVLDDLRGQVDTFGRPLVMTQAAVADEIASAGELVKGKAEGRPLAVVRGLGHLVTDDDGPGARALVRLGRRGHVRPGQRRGVLAGLEGRAAGPVRAQPAFAAALAACFVARTSLSDTGSVTSAIDRRAPGSP